jgi:hypothetical protein
MAGRPACSEVPVGACTYRSGVSNVGCCAQEQTSPGWFRTAGEEQDAVFGNSRTMSRAISHTVWRKRSLSFIFRTDVQVVQLPARHDELPMKSARFSLDRARRNLEDMQCFNRSRLYVKRNKAEMVESEFAQFFDHLKTLPWIKELL